MNSLSRRMSLMKPSGTLVIADLARKLKSEGKTIYDLAEGESNFRTPELISEAAKEAIDRGFTQYTEVDGIPALKEAIQIKYLADTGKRFDLDRIIVGAGAKQLIFSAFMATINQEDEVVIPAPFWVSYRDMVEVFGGKVVVVDTKIENAFQPSMADLEKSFTDKTKWLVLNSPNNPSGAVYTKEFYEDLDKVLAEHPNIMVMSDEIYEEITYNGHRAPTVLASAPGLRDRALVINGVSKKYAMTGWRIGYAVGTTEVIASIKTIVGQTTTNACSVSQAAAVEALTGSQAFFEEFKGEYKSRRDFVVKELGSVNGLSFAIPSGAFYIFVSCEDLLNKYKHDDRIIETDVDVAGYLMEVAGVSVVPGTAFNKPGYFRICFAKDLAILEKAMERIKESLSQLTKN